MLYYSYLKSLSNVDMSNELENLIIKKSCEIGHLQNRIEEQQYTPIIFGVLLFFIYVKSTSYVHLSLRVFFLNRLL